MNSLFYKFLEDLHIPEKIIDTLQLENIDSHAIRVMEDSELEKFITKYGDRIAIRDYCEKQFSNKKISLIEKLRDKINSKRSRKSLEKNDHEKQENKKKKKDTRLIEVGWMLSLSGDKLKQVRTNQGGGTRKLEVKKISTVSEIQALAQKLFFPNGESNKGPISKFSVSMLDFKFNKIDANITVGNIFEETGLRRIRFYFATREIVSTSVIDLTDPEAELNNEEQDNHFHCNELDFNQEFLVTNISTIENSLTSEAISLPSLELPTSDGDDHSLHFNLDEDFAKNIFTESEIPSSMKTKLPLHRGKIFEEMLEAFQLYKLKSEILEIEMISNNGKIELGVDIGGVLRDALSEFWESFYDKCTLGTFCKIPCLRHDFGEAQWEAVADILYNGWLYEKYWPVKISKTFFYYILDKNYQVKTIDLQNDFLNFISISDKKLVEDAIIDFNNIDIDDMIEFVDGFDSKWIPNSSNFQNLLNDIAHKEIIQKPMFIITCFQESLLNKIVIDLNAVYADFPPTSKNILKRLKIKENEEHKVIFEYLKKFIKECDDKMRAEFVRFCTGSNITNNDIDVAFIDVDGFQRMPIAHTCANLLELPSTYENYLALRNEFSKVLESKFLIMDFI